LTIKARSVVFLTFFAAILACGSLFFFSYLHRGVSFAAISRVSDFTEFLLATPSGWIVKNAEFDTICFTGNNVFALAQSKSFLPPNEVNSRSVLESAGGIADLFNGASHTSIVLLSHQKAQILQLDRRAGFSLKNVGCMVTNQANVQINNSDSTTELELPNASLGVTHG
jgi:hypothetical protein